MDQQSQCTKVLEHLRSGPLTQNDALRLYGIARLASRINALKKYYPIQSRKIKVQTRTGSMATVAEYYLRPLTDLDKKIQYYRQVLAGYPDRPHPNKAKIEAQLEELEKKR